MVDAHCCVRDEEDIPCTVPGTMVDHQGGLRVGLGFALFVEVVIRPRAAQNESAPESRKSKGGIYLIASKPQIEGGGGDY